ncbi:unnamed protein product [Soboliphyme baturini]|uniref:Midasin n=1 Tax=Soboliphyme baturini TaxID=241478 RepID=A0A183IZG0_9BILA|nr:unnamed protein product [Soboliphyme baturini]
MNPGTEVGKRELPVGIRNRFTEIFVDDLDQFDDLCVVVQTYLSTLQPESALVYKVVKFYLAVRTMANSLTSGILNQRPNISLRTLCRALSWAKLNTFGNLVRSIYEGLCLSFLSDLDSESYAQVESLIVKYLMSADAKILKHSTHPPSDGAAYIEVEGYWIAQGPNPLESDSSYMVTAQVKKNLHKLCRAASSRLFPILIQGETSVGKTSMIQYLAKLTGNQCFRINNHEHTDMQEYVGSYVTDSSGKLTFVEGPLVKAMRSGAWIILDELNLAEPEILEALNRAKLFVAETQETVKAHPNFILFATQNPAGLYSGRKRLSRAFRNRFIELNFEQLPFNELELILHHRCALPQSYARKMVNVMRDLQFHRSTTGLFAGKEGHMTLRDLFRWGERYKRCDATCPATDWDQYLAEQGFLLLGGRSRREEDLSIVRETISKHFLRKINDIALFSTDSTYFNSQLIVCCSAPHLRHIVWTKNLRRMAVLLSQALMYDEPVLLIGDTGCGKTTLCQIYAALTQRTLHVVNCHLSTEAADFVGRLVPASQEKLEEGILFEWRDGALVEAMTNGDLLLIDEISLADDSVLERLNSVLELDKELLLYEKIASDQDVVSVKATPGFQLMATMNPGGDYGKKELSKALRNRFTEIWCDASYEEADVNSVLVHNLQTGDEFAVMIFEYLTFLSREGLQHRNRFTLSIRDMLSWVSFINICSSAIETPLAYAHGACAVFLDGFGCQKSSTSSEASQFRTASLRFLKHQLQRRCNTTLSVDCVEHGSGVVERDLCYFGIKPFFIKLGSRDTLSTNAFNFEANTTKKNLFRVLRAMQLSKPIMLEGSPGVGKSGLELSDLFGTDLPVVLPNGKQGFAWSDGPLLSAMKTGSWVLIDEMNLASQSVLEGLNACFDHRKEIFIPELGKTFKIDEDASRFFACQNPLSQGASRKGLPQSFLNRFSTVFVEELTVDDQAWILSKLYPSIDHDVLLDMVAFNVEISEKVCVLREFGGEGSPWDFNLRDLMRWCELMLTLSEPYHSFIEPLFCMRMRREFDRQMVRKTFFERRGISPSTNAVTTWHLSPGNVCIADVIAERGSFFAELHPGPDPLILQSSLKYLRTLLLCVRMNYLAILVGKGAVGKSFMIYLLSLLCGRRLHILHATSETDATELVGGFEQVRYFRCSSAKASNVFHIC